MAAAIAVRVLLVEVAIAHAAGRRDDARMAFAAIPALPGTAAVAQLAALVAGTPAAATAAPTAMFDSLRLFTALPRYEGAAAVASSDDVLRKFLIGGAPKQKKPVRNAFSGSVPFFNSNGFKDKPMKDGRGTTIEFTGDNSSPMAVEEMTLLRAADLAVAAGKPGFIILDKRDFSRSTQMTINGSPGCNATPAGFMTQLGVAFADTGADSDRFIAADAVIADLAPVYRPS